MESLPVFLQAFLWALIQYAEIIGTLLSITYLLLCIFQSNWCWLFGGLGSALYILVFFQSKFYADMSLQFYYVFISFYGWYHWRFGKHQADKKQISVVKTPRRVWLPLTVATALVFAGYAYLLHTYTDSPVVVGDSFTAATAILATYMLSRKYIENWLLFIVSDGVCIGLYIYKGLYITAILFVVYTVMAVWGYFDWRKEMKKQNLISSPPQV
ncbi:MAG: nicotinamide riboside transporter PnuC [Paludibacteraceae bacterium]|nr:nicotinamide riboside transporter PnuC [Paludibacteraceae bacterium]